MAVKILAVVQARMRSTRLPGKVLREVNGKSLIEILLHRISKAKRVDKIVLATGNTSHNDVLATRVESLGYEVFRGNEDNVLDRYYQAAKTYHAATIVRITGDCPIIDPNIIDQVIDLHQGARVDYASNTIPPTFPDGLDTEVFSFEALEEAWKNAVTNYDKEHVTPFIKSSNQFRRQNFPNEVDLSAERWTVDEPEDLEVIQGILTHFAPNLDFSWTEVLELKRSHPKKFLANKGIKRNEGAEMGAGQKLYKRAKKIIPGGTMLLSKRPEMFLPDQWPSYFTRAKGCKVWDLDGREFVDLSIMGIGTNTLGYGQREVDNAVREVIEKGNMSTLNCPEEVHLAERLIQLHPWADMARFARSGGEANAIAIRIARAAAENENVAICGYHGWHDWYLSANLGNQSHLDGHLLPGLQPRGVPRGLQGTVLPFRYNDLDQLEDIVRKHQIGIIKMEVSRSTTPEIGYLEAVRQLATDQNIVLIFDECTSGFRETFGGLHLKYGVEPDMVILGKALGNGYAISAVLGRSEIMEMAESTFISSTFWTERIGPAAALKTLEIMEQEKSWEKITNTGRVIAKRWREISKKHELPLKVQGIPALVGFTIPVENELKYKTLLTQEMLKQGILAANSVYVCTEHTESVLEDYFEKLDPIFALIAECEAGRNVDDLLEGPVCHSGFRRLN